MTRRCHFGGDLFFNNLVSKVIPAERIAVLSHTDTGEVVTSAVHLTSGKDPGSFNLSSTIINEILKERNSILINPQEDDRFAGQESIIISEIKSAMAVPLFDDDKVLGILYVDTTNPLHIYNNDYLRLLATFGNLVASRLLNYELILQHIEMVYKLVMLYLILITDTHIYILCNKLSRCFMVKMVNE